MAGQRARAAQPDRAPGAADARSEDPPRGPARGDPQRRARSPSSKARPSRTRAAPSSATSSASGCASTAGTSRAPPRRSGSRARASRARCASSASGCRVSEPALPRRAGGAGAAAAHPRDRRAELRRALVRGRLRRGVREPRRRGLGGARRRRRGARLPGGAAGPGRGARALPRGRARRAAARRGARRCSRRRSPPSARSGARIAHLEVRAVERRPRWPSTRAPASAALGRRRRYYPDGEDALLLARGAGAGAARRGRAVNSAALPQRCDAARARERGLRRREPAGCASPWARRSRPARPGQFVMLSPGALPAAPRFDPLLPRPMAVFRRDGARRSRCSTR